MFVSLLKIFFSYLEKIFFNYFKILCINWFWPILSHSALEKNHEKSLLYAFPNKNGAYQSAYPCSLIAFLVRCLMWLFSYTQVCMFWYSRVAYVVCRIMLRYVFTNGHDVKCFFKMEFSSEEDMKLKHYFFDHITIIKKKSFRSMIFTFILLT